MVPAGAGAGLIQNAVAPVQGVVSGVQNVAGPAAPVVGRVNDTAGQVAATADSVVDPPAAPSTPAPAVPNIPGAPPAVNNTINTLNNGLKTTTGGGSGSTGSQPSHSPGRSSGSSGGASPTARGGSASRGGGGGGGSSQGGGGAGRGGTGGGGAPKSPGGRGGPGAPAGGAGAPAVNARPAASKSPKSSDSSSNPVASVINRISNAIPAPLWGLIGALALLALGFALRSRLVSVRARRLERQRAELLGDVGLLQRALLPEVPSDLSGIEVSVAYRPAEGPAAGGDFYDVFPLDDKRTAIIVGDVCGHGRQALAVTALMRYTLRAYIGAGFEPRIALQVAGRTIAGDAEAELTTVVLAIYDASLGTLTYACAGHEPPIVLGANATEPITLLSSPPLAAPMSTGHRQTTMALPPGASACFFTDGLVEARLGDEMIGRQVLTEVLAELEPDDGAQLLLDRIAQRADRAPDDMAACLVRTHADAVSGPPVRTEELALEREDLYEAGRAVDFLTACGLDVKQAGDAVVAARAKAAEFGGALIRVLSDSAGATVEVKGTDGVRLAVPSLEVARNKAASLLSASA
jgi:hypothetical protein